MRTGKGYAVKAIRVLLVLALVWPGVVSGNYISGNDLMGFCDGTGPGEPKASVAEYNSCASG